MKERFLTGPIAALITTAMFLSTMLLVNYYPPASLHCVNPFH